MDEKYRVMDKERVKASKNWAVKKVREWHDKVNPDYIILTESSAVPFGWLLKNTWKEMYPDERVPKFFRSAVGYSEHPRGRRDQSIGALFPGSEEKNYFHKRKIDSNKVALIFDETQRDDESHTLMKAHENGKYAGYRTNNHTLRLTVRQFSSGLKNMWIDSGSPGVPMHARAGDYYLPKMPKKQRELRQYEAEPDSYIKPTRKSSASFKEFKYMQRSFIGVLEKNPKLRKRAFDYIHDLKLAGKEAGIEAREKEQKTKSLENKVTSVIVIMGLVGSLVLFSSNITGNAIADLTFKTSSTIGIGLFAIALISGFFWLRNRRKK